MKDLLSKIRKERGLSRPAAKECLAGIRKTLHGQRPSCRRQAINTNARSPNRYAGLRMATNYWLEPPMPDTSGPPTHWMSLRKYGTSDQIAIEVRFVTTW